MAIATLPHDLVHARGSGQLLQRLGHRGMEAADRGEALCQQLLESIEPLLQRTGLRKTIAHRCDAPAPEIFQRGMPFRELVGVHAEQHLSGSRAKLGTDGTKGLGDVTDVKPCTRSPDHRGADQMTLAVTGVVEQAQRIVGPAEDKVHRPGRNDVLPAGR